MLCILINLHLFNKVEVYSMTKLDLKSEDIIIIKNESMRLDHFISLGIFYLFFLLFYFWRIWPNLMKS